MNLFEEFMCLFKGLGCNVKEFKKKMSLKKKIKKENLPDVK